MTVSTVLGTFLFAGNRFEATVDDRHGWRVGCADGGGSVDYSGRAASREKAIADARAKLESVQAVFELAGMSVTPIMWHGEGAGDECSRPARLYRETAGIDFVIRPTRTFRHGGHGRKSDGVTYTADG